MFSVRTSLVALFLSGLGASVAGAAATRSPAAFADLGSRDRYLIHIATDKPVYNAGEKVRVRAVVLNAADNSPLPRGLSTDVAFEVRGPRDSVRHSGTTRIKDAVASFAWKMPDAASSGRYAVTVKAERLRIAPAVRQFRVFDEAPKRFAVDIEFVREGYGPGDTAVAVYHIERAGGIPDGAVRVTPTGRLDGAELFMVDAGLDRHGNGRVSIDLPSKIEHGHGTFALTVVDGFATETFTRSIPVVVKPIVLAAFPEGGYVIGGLTSRVYIEARHRNGRPADVAGNVLDSHGTSVGTFATSHEGRGRFEFPAVAGERYTLKISEPTGIDGSYTLASFCRGGVALRTLEDSYAPGAPITFDVTSTYPQKVRVTLGKRERVLADCKVSLKSGGTKTLKLDPPAKHSGVLALTVWDARRVHPLAERLVFRAPSGSLDVKVEADRTSYAPGQKVTLRVRTADSRGLRVSALVGLAVTDRRAFSIVEKRLRPPRLPVMALLEGEVKSLEDAAIYLDPNDERADLALDLLLGTQGWRRFALRDPRRFLADKGESAQRALAYLPPPKDSTREQSGDLASLLTNGKQATVAGGPSLALAGGHANGSNDNAGTNKQSSRGRAPGSSSPRRSSAGSAPATGAAPSTGSVSTPGAGLPVGAVSLDPPTAPGESSVTLVPVREFAADVHPLPSRPARRDAVRTVCWLTRVRTNAATGEATLTFPAGSSSSLYSVRADAVSARGHLGSASGSIRTSRPFAIQARLPSLISVGDTVHVPVLARTTGKGSPANVRLSVTATGPVAARLVPAVRGADHTLEVTATGNAGVADIIVHGTFRRHTDRVSLPLKVRAKTVPVTLYTAGVLLPDQTETAHVELPEDAVSPELEATVTLFPRPISTIIKSIQHWSREPTGCCSQTTAALLPAIQAQLYFAAHPDSTDPGLIKRGKGYVTRGMARMRGFKAANGGYEWFGGGRGNIAVTAQTLLLFHDVCELGVNCDDLYCSARDWVLARRNGMGGYKHGDIDAPAFGVARQLTSDAYTTWALVQTGVTDLDAELKALDVAAAESDDSYVIALAAGALSTAGLADAADKHMKRLADAQQSDGAVVQEAASITFSGGRSLLVETTALSLLAWTAQPAYAINADRAYRCIMTHNHRGNFGSTQATALALRAINTYDVATAVGRSAGTVTVTVNGVPHPTQIVVPEDAVEPIEIPLRVCADEKGQCEIGVTFESGRPLPYTVTTEYVSNTLPETTEKRLQLDVSMSDNRLTVGDVAELNVVVTNTGGSDAGMPVAVVGIPAGLEIRLPQMDEFVEAGLVDKYEVRNGGLVLYWRGIPAQTTVTVPVPVSAAAPGAYQGTHCRLYRYYTAEHTVWREGVAVTVDPLDVF